MGGASLTTSRKEVMSRKQNQDLVTFIAAGTLVSSKPACEWPACSYGQIRCTLFINTLI